MAKLTDNQRLGVVAGVAVFLAGLGGGGVWWAKGLVQEKVDAIAQMRNEIGEAQAKIQKIPRVEQDVIILRENLYEYVKILPEATELNNFVRVTNQFRSQSGVVVTQFLPGSSRPGKASAFERYTYKFELRATLWQFMQFMSFFEDYERFVQVQDFSLSSGTASNATGVQDIVHRITMTVETYVYRASAQSSDVQIANYAHKVEKLREEIFEARQTIAKAGYKFQGARGRRDIFVDPRESSGSRPAGQDGPSPRDQRRIIERLQTKLTECQEIYERLQDKSITIFDKYSLERRLRKQLSDLDKEVEEANAKAYISHAPLKLTWNREVIEPLTNLKREVAAVRAEQRDKWLPEAEMKSLLARMRDNLLAGDISGAVEQYDLVEERIRVHRNDHRYETYRKIEGLYLRAKLAEEFGSLRLDISGICVNDVGKSGVILNGTVYEEGEYVDNNLLIKSVGRDKVEFVYKGFTVVRTL